jgi:hypothetical protein
VCGCNCLAHRRRVPAEASLIIIIARDEFKSCQEFPDKEPN